MPYAPRETDPCCGDRHAERESDGLTDTFRCSTCRGFIAELVIGPEP